MNAVLEMKEYAYDSIKDSFQNTMMIQINTFFISFKLFLRYKAYSIIEFIC